MAALAIAVLAVLAVWWLSTATILWLDGMPRSTFGRSLFGVSLVLIVSLYGIAATKDDTSVAGAYLAFLSGVGVWSWLELTFLMGYITGPRRRACPGHCTGAPHFRHAIEAILYHEIAILTIAACTIAAAWGGANRIGVSAVLVLWGMRASAKLNLYFGVRNLAEELLPPHLAYMRSFFRRRPMNLLFPFSITAGSIVVTLFVLQAMAPAANDFEVTSWTLLASLAGLGLIEHWMLILPFPTTALWSWGMRARREPAA